MSRENYVYWKELVGLDEVECPHLMPISYEKIHLAKIAQSRILEIKQAISTNELVDIQVQPGWGATTLFRYVANEYSHSELKLMILLDFEEDKLEQEVRSEEEFIFKIKWKMAYGMQNIMIKESFQERFMYEIFDFEDNGRNIWKRHLREKKDELEKCEEDKKMFYEKFSFFSKNNIEDCLNYFLEKFQIQSIFMYLFPDFVEEDTLLEFIGIIKNLFDGKTIFPAAKREVYILAPDLFDQIRQAYERPYKNIYYKQYSSAEIFGMLINTYELHDTPNATICDVFEQEFIEEKYDPDATLNEIMDDVEDEIIKYLDGEISDVPYKLSFRRKIKH